MTIKVENGIYSDKKAMLDIVTEAISSMKVISKRLEKESEQGYCYRCGKKIEGAEYKNETDKMKLKLEVLAELFKGENCQQYIYDSEKEVSNEVAKKIIETGEPLGKFYTFDNGIYVGIDNSDGHMWVEDFKTKKECLNWLHGRELEDEYELEI